MFDTTIESFQHAGAIANTAATSGSLLGTGDAVITWVQAAAAVSNTLHMCLYY